MADAYMWGLGRHTCSALGVVVVVATSYLYILTLLLDKLPKWLSCRPLSQISWVEMFPRSRGVTGEQ